MKSARILIVEDDMRMRVALKEIMVKEGHMVDSVETGEAALTKAGENNYDLVITDLKLPGIDGMDVLNAIHKSRPETAIIMITAYATVDTAVEAMRAGAEDYICKPFTANALTARLERVLNIHECVRV